MSLIAIPPTGSRAESTDAQQSAELQRVVTPHIQRMLPDGIGGVAVAVRIDGRTLFLNYGLADAASNRPVTSDSLFNLASLRKAFEATLLALAVDRGELRLDDPIDKYVTELARGRDIRRVTIGQLATHTSGLLLPQDHAPWPDWGYTLPHFIRTLKAWRADAEQAPGKQHMYTHGGYVLLQLALERRFGMPIAALLEQRVIAAARPVLDRDAAARRRRSRRAPPGAAGARGAGLFGRRPADRQARRPANLLPLSRHRPDVLLGARPGRLPRRQSRRDRRRMRSLRRRCRPRTRAGSPSARTTQALAWEINDNSEPPIVEKNGGLNNSSTYIGMMPQRQLGIVILVNRGSQDPAEIGRRILEELAAP